MTSLDDVTAIMSIPFCVMPIISILYYAIKYCKQETKLILPSCIYLLLYYVQSFISNIYVNKYLHTSNVILDIIFQKSHIHLFT